MTTQKIQIIAPAGDWISARTALENGANAIYFGTKELNMRATTKNFSLYELPKLSKLAKKHNAKTYLTLNTIIYDNEIKKADKIIKKAKSSNIDAIICWDHSVISLCKKNKMPFHISTQASISNYQSVKYYTKLGAKMIVLARELTLPQITHIIKQIKKDKLNVKIETFIHGAMCVSVSGRCFISQFQFNKSANRGECIQPCRRKYNVSEYSIIDPEEKNELKLNNNYVMSPKDMCTLPFIDKLIDAGIFGFKIEGRNRSPEYVKNTVTAYLKTINHYTINKSKIKKNDKELKKYNTLKQDQLALLKSVYNRGFSNGFFMGIPVNEWTNYYGSKSKTKKQLVGVVKNYFQKPKVSEIHLQSHGIKKGDKLMIQGPTTGLIEFTAKQFLIDKKESTNASKGDIITIPTQKTRKNDKLYKIVNIK